MCDVLVAYVRGNHVSTRHVLCGLNCECALGHNSRQNLCICPTKLFELLLLINFLLQSYPGQNIPERDILKKLLISPIFGDEFYDCMHVLNFILNTGKSHDGNQKKINTIMHLYVHEWWLGVFICSIPIQEKMVITCEQQTIQYAFQVQNTQFFFYLFVSEPLTI